MHIATYIRIKAYDGIICQSQRHVVGLAGRYMGVYASICHLTFTKMSIYARPAPAQMFYASIRSVMHQPLSVL